MNCLYNMISWFRTNPEIRRAAYIGKNFNSAIEWIHAILTCFFMLFGCLMVTTGTAFVRHDLLNSAQFGLKSVESMATALIVCYCILILIFGLSSLLITYYRDCHTCCIAIYGTLIFFIIAVPLMAEGTAILELDRISNGEIQLLCDIPLKEVKKNNGKMVYSILEMAHRYDVMSEQLITRYMCTNATCPCSNY